MSSGTPQGGIVAAPTVTVVICVYTDTRWKAMVEAVDSAQHQTLPATEVVVVVDHNPPLLERCRQAFSAATVVPSSGPPGLAGARNTGVACAATCVIAFLDDDARADSDWLSRLVAPYADPRVLGVGGLVEPAWSRRRPRSMPPEFDWVVGCSYVGLPVRAAEVRNLIGANMSLRASVFDEVGGFAPGLGRVGSLPAGCEETELCIRARARFESGRFVYEPRAVVHHRVGAERQTWRYFRSRCFAEGRSKALVSGLVGSGAALSSERAYVRRALLRGLARDLGEAFHGDVMGIVRAARIAAGLSVTTVGYATGRLAAARMRGSTPAPAPVLVSAAIIAATTPLGENS